MTSPVRNQTDRPEHHHLMKKKSKLSLFTSSRQEKWSERVYCLFQIKSSVIKGSQGKNLKQKLTGNAVIGLLSLALSQPAFSYNPEPLTCPGIVLSTVAWALSQQSPARKCPTDMPTDHSD